MGRIKLAEARLSFELLLEQEQYAQAVRVLESALPEFGDPKGLVLMLELLRRLPQDYLCKSIEAATLYAKTLRISGALEQLLEWNTQVIACQGVVDSAPVQVEAAAALNGLRRYAEARVLLEHSIPHLSGEPLGITWARLGYALFNLHEPIELWREAYTSAHSLLKGEELGRALFNFGYCLALTGFYAESQSIYLEALICFRNNPFFQAWTRYNLGLGALRELQPDTERHFLEAVRITRNPKAAGLRPSVLNGLGSYRRALGEWTRAETAHREALHVASDTLQRETAYRGLARTQRLAGHPVEALETLELALQEQGLEYQLIHLERALAFLALGQAKQAHEALDKTGAITSEITRWLWHITRAELARLEGRPEEALALLEGLPTYTLSAREEVRQFPKLFDLLRQAGQPTPPPLEYVSQTVVQVQALGVLSVSVNGRPVNITPTGRAGEVLCILLESQGQTATERLVDMLWPRSTVGEKRHALWQLVKELRDALGWPESIQAKRKAYVLDPHIRWDYDVNQARAAKRVTATFLDGVYSDWTQEVNDELETYREQKNAS